MEAERLKKEIAMLRRRIEKLAAENQEMKTEIISTWGSA